MTDGFHALLQRELASGFDNLPGLAVSGEIPFRQELLNAILRDAPKVPRDARIDIGIGNQIVVRAGVLRATAVLDDRVELREAPLVRMRLASSLVAFGLRALGLPPFVSIDGRIVTIDLSRVPALAPHRSLLRHLKHATLVTEPGVLYVGFEWRVG
jgi:hypothetical protein